MIRFANVNDAEELGKIHYESVIRTYQGIYTEDYFKHMSLKSYIASWRKYLGKGNYRTIVSVNDNECIQGFAAVGLFVRRKIGWLDYFHVKADEQHKGIGSQLISAACGLLAFEGIESMELLYAEGNDNARRFYDKYGAKYIGSYYRIENGELHFNNKLRIDKLSSFASENPLSLGFDAEYKKLLSYVKDDFIIWGVGNYYNYWVEQFGETVKPKIFFDSNEDINGLYANGVQVVLPHKTDIPIIIACSQYDEIEEKVKELGCTNYVGFYPWHDYSL